MTEKSFTFTVVIPVYKVEAYLAETLDSVIAQSIGFEEHIQVILVNDGSPDRSDKICLDYQMKFPDNIIYLEKENGGVSSARNYAVPYIKGKYVNFLDSDDCWESGAMEAVRDFFDEHYEETDVVGCRKEFFGAKSGYHYLDYKFESSRVIDLRKNPECIQLDVTAAFIKAQAIGEHRFSERLKYGEDAQFITSVILEKCRLGVCREAVHRYRKRMDNSSALQNDIKSSGYYFDTPKYFMQALFDESREKYGAAEKFIQFTVMYELGWRIRKKGIRQYLTQEEYDNYCGTLISILKQIDDDIIRQQRVLWKKHKLFCLMKKHGMDSAAELFCRIGKLETVFGP